MIMSAHSTRIDVALACTQDVFYPMRPLCPCVPMHPCTHAGTVYANYAVDQADLLIALGVRFDDRVTGRLEAFAQHAKIVHIDIDAAEIGKNKIVHTPVGGGGRWRGEGYKNEAAGKARD